mmetsp:Transcript_24842/g.53600  ORF Transcript_24842/g.53600 Transcript_24842/m.53600 type:complete len:233 (+) Transcript_24842:465-1163(+)
MESTWLASARQSGCVGNQLGWRTTRAASWAPWWRLQAATTSSSGPTGCAPPFAPRSPMHSAQTREPSASRTTMRDATRPCLSTRRLGYPTSPGALGIRRSIWAWTRYQPWRARWWPCSSSSLARSSPNKSARSAQRKRLEHSSRLRCLVSLLTSATLTSSALCSVPSAGCPRFSSSRAICTSRFHAAASCSSVIPSKLSSRTLDKVPTLRSKTSAYSTAASQSRRTIRLRQS